MKKSKFNLIFLLMLGLPLFSVYSKNMLMPNENKVIDLGVVIFNSHGSIKYTGEASKYMVSIGKRRYSVVIGSDHHFCQAFSMLYPDDIIVKFTFSDVMPKTSIYIDDNKYGEVDGNGAFVNGTCYPMKNGHHTVELKKLNMLVDHVTLDISHASNIECAGRKMQCKEIN